MKITKARIKEIILEELNEVYVTDIAGDDEDRAIDRHRAAKRARGEYPPRPSSVGSNCPPPSEEMQAQLRTQAIVNATTMILKMNPHASLAVDPDTYRAIEMNAPEFLDRISITQSGLRR